MKKAIALVGLSLALEAGFLFQIALPARGPAPANVPAAVRADSGAACPASTSAVVQKAALRPGRG